MTFMDVFIDFFSEMLYNNVIIIMYYYAINSNCFNVGGLKMNTREEIVNYVNSDGQYGALLIKGERGSGKTHLLKEIQKEWKENTSDYSMIIVSLFGISTAEMLIEKVNAEIADASEKYVLVFDDFERCGADYSSIFGIINDYAENKGIKVIIAESDLEDEKNDVLKEKVVSRTVRIMNDYKEITDSIISNYNGSESYKTFLADNNGNILSVFLSSGYNNLRALKNVVYDFERFYNVWKIDDYSAADAGVKKRLSNCLYQFAAVYFETKLNQTILTGNEDDEEIEKIKEISESKYRKDTFNGVPNAVDKWISDGKWCEAEYLSCVNPAENMSAEEKILRLNIYELCDDIINVGTEPLIKKAESGQLSFNSLAEFLVKIHLLREIGYEFSINYPLIEQLCDEKIKAYKALADDDICTIWYDEQRVDSEAAGIINKLKAVFDDRDDFEKEIEIIEILKNPTNENIISIFKNKDEIIFADVVIGAVFEAYKNSDNEIRNRITSELNGVIVKKINASGTDKNTLEEISVQLIEIQNKLNTILNGESDKIARYVITSAITSFETSNDKISRKIEELHEIAVNRKINMF